MPPVGVTFTIGFRYDLLSWLYAISLPLSSASGRIGIVPCTRERMGQFRKVLTYGNEPVLFDLGWNAARCVHTVDYHGSDSSLLSEQLLVYRFARRRGSSSLTVVDIHMTTMCGAIWSTTTNRQLTPLRWRGGGETERG